MSANHCDPRRLRRCRRQLHRYCGRLLQLGRRPFRRRIQTVIERWLASRGHRDRVVIATNVGQAGSPGEGSIRGRVEGSLRPLQTDYIDQYYAHRDDPGTPLEETLSTFPALVRSGRVRHIGASNYDLSRIGRGLVVLERNGLSRFVALSQHSCCSVLTRRSTHRWPRHRALSAFPTTAWPAGASAASVGLGGTPTRGGDGSTAAGI